MICRRSLWSLATVAASIISIVRFALSTIPSLWGRNAHVLVWRISSSARVSRNSADWKFFPWSVCTTSGGPNLQTNSSTNALATVPAI